MIKLSKKAYTIKRETLEVLLEILQDNWFYDDVEGESHNNDAIIDAEKLLEAEIKKQEDL